jgi:hypothetical protein
MKWRGYETVEISKEPPFCQMHKNFIKIYFLARVAQFLYESTGGKINADFIVVDPLLIPYFILHRY